MGMYCNIITAETNNLFRSNPEIKFICYVFWKMEIGLKRIVGILTKGIEVSEGRSWLKLWGSNDGRSPSIDPIGKEKMLVSGLHPKNLWRLERDWGQ